MERLSGQNIGCGSAMEKLGGRRENNRLTVGARVEDVSGALSWDMDRKDAGSSQVVPTRN